MISTTFKDGSKFTLLDWFFVAAKSSLLLYAAILIISSYGCNAPPQEQHVRARIITTPQVTEERPVYPPTGSPALAEKEQREQPKVEEPPYYGTTYWNELLTSVYYYPNDGGRGDAVVPATHLKFGHREEDIWLCGDQRKTFKPGYQYRLMITFEPNQPCATNWEIK